MDIIQSIKQTDPNLLLFLLTSLIAFISWIVKGLIEKPINDSKLTFEKTYNTRVEILTEVKNRLSFILYFKNGEENKNFKEQIQELLLKDGKSAYLSKIVLDNTIRLSIEEENNDKLIKETISLIDTELYQIISKIEDEITFYRKFSNYNPLKKAIGITLLALQNIITILSIGLTIYFIISFYFEYKILTIIFSSGVLIFTNWYLSKK